MNQPAPATPCLYFGKTMHARMQPFTHRFTYRVFSILLDIDAIDAAAAGAKLFSYNAFNIFSFFDKDHGDRTGAPLRAWAEARLAEAGVPGAARIELLCFPRVLGHVFNPLSIYYCYDADDTPIAIIYEVNNTFGETHAYVAPAEVTRDAAAPIRQQADKTFYVSPFFEVAGRYDFTLPPPGQRLDVHIRAHRDAKTQLVATLNGNRRALTDGHLASAFVRYPMMTWKVVGAIHWEALHLWRKGAAYVSRRPKPEATSSVGRPTPAAPALPNASEDLPSTAEADASASPIHGKAAMNQQELSSTAIESVQQTEQSPAAPASWDFSGIPYLARLAIKVAARVRWGTIIVELPGGRTFRFEGAERPDEVGVIQIKDYKFAPRLMFGGTVGFFQAFTDDQWDSPDVAQFLRIVAANADLMGEYFSGNFFVRQINRLGHAFNRNTKAGSRRNIMAHYDLGNAFYERWLDKTMTYSSAKFAHPDQDLQDAQINKYRELAERIDLKPGDHVLEIGSGWGGFAEFAAGEVGAKVTGITISQEQFDFATERMAKAGLSDKVEIRLQDYRDVSDTFDKVASIEMFEAVGKEYWPTYFKKVREVLRPGGLAGLQIITIDDQYFDRYTKSTDFIQRFVFPGGMLPSPGALRKEIVDAGLAWRDNVTFGVDYANTLRNWQERFLGAWDDIRPLGFDDRFKKLWRYYLSYCEAGFRGGTIDVTQVTLARP